MVKRIAVRYKSAEVRAAAEPERSIVWLLLCAVVFSRALGVNPQNPGWTRRVIRIAPCGTKNIPVGLVAALRCLLLPLRLRLGWHLDVRVRAGRIAHGFQVFDRI